MQGIWNESKCITRKAKFVKLWTKPCLKVLKSLKKLEVWKFTSRMDRYSTQIFYSEFCITLVQYLSSLTCQLHVSYICKPVELPQGKKYICYCELKFKIRKKSQLLKNAVTLRQKQASVLSKALNLIIKHVGERYDILKLAYFDWQNW